MKFLWRLRLAGLLSPRCPSKGLPKSPWDPLNPLILQPMPPYGPKGLDIAKS